MSRLAEPRADSPLKAVLIVGPGNTISDGVKRLYYEPDREGKFTSPKEGYLIIGDGKKPVKQHKIQALEGRLEPGTRVDLLGHGGIGGKGFLEKRHHRITMIDGIPTTKGVLDLVSSVSGGNPLETHVWSCFGGLAARDASALPKGSCVLAHGSENQSILTSVANKGLEESVRSRQKYEEWRGAAAKPVLDYDRVVEKLHLGCEQKCFVGISGVKGTCGFRIPAKKIFDTKAIAGRINKFKSSVINKLGSLTAPGIMGAITADPEKLSSKRLSAIQARFGFAKLCEGKAAIKKTLKNASSTDLSKLVTSAKTNGVGLPVAAAISGDIELIKAMNKVSGPPTLQSLTANSKRIKIPAFSKCLAEHKTEDLISFTPSIAQTSPDHCKAYFSELGKRGVSQKDALLTKKADVAKFLMEEAGKAGIDKTKYLSLKDNNGKSAHDLREAVEPQRKERETGVLGSASPKSSLVSRMIQRFSKSSKTQTSTAAPSAAIKQEQSSSRGR